MNLATTNLAEGQMFTWKHSWRKIALEELAFILGVIEQAISYRLKSFKMIEKDLL